MWTSLVCGSSLYCLIWWHVFTHGCDVMWLTEQWLQGILLAFNKAELAHKENICGRRARVCRYTDIRKALLGTERSKTACSGLWKFGGLILGPTGLLFTAQDCHPGWQWLVLLSQGKGQRLNGPWMPLSRFELVYTQKLHWFNLNLFKNQVS